MLRKLQTSRMSADHIYVNANIYNSTNNPILAEYNTDISENYLDCSGDYYVSVIRFDIPNTFHIFTFIDGLYQVILRYNNIDYSTVLTFQNVDMSAPDSRLVWTFQQFLDMINSAFQDSYDDLITANPSAPPTEAPYIIYNENTNLFSLMVQQLYDPVVAAAPTIEIYWNNDLNLFFANSFTTFNYGINLPSGRDYQFKITNQYNNIVADPPNYYEFKQQINTLFSWYDFSGIIISSSELPVSKEYKTFYTTDGKAIQSPILTDFIPELGKDKSNFLYNANPYRLIDLDGNLPLKRFGFKIFWVDKKGIQFPYYLPPNFFISIKFGFFKKTSLINL